MAKAPQKTLAQLARERANRAAENAARAAAEADEREAQPGGGMHAGGLARDARARANEALDHARQLAQAADAEEEAERKRGVRRPAVQASQAPAGPTLADLPKMSASEIAAALSDDQRAGLADQLGAKARPAAQAGALTHDEHFQAGFAAGNALCAAVIASDEFAGREPLAAELIGLAQRENLSAESIIKILTKAPRWNEGAAGSAEEMRQVLAEQWVYNRDCRDPDEEPSAELAPYVAAFEAKLGLAPRRRSASAGDHGWGAAREKARKLSTNPVAAAHAEHAAHP